MPIGKFVVRTGPRNPEGQQDTLREKQCYRQGALVWAVTDSVSESPSQRDSVSEDLEVL